MKRAERSHLFRPATTLTRLELPPHVPATPEEIARRRALGRQAEQLRAQMPPLGMSTSELVRSVRDEAEGYDDDDEGEALGLWQIREQERAMEAQFGEDLTPEDVEERAAWRAMRDAAAKQRFGLE